MRASIVRVFLSSPGDVWEERLLLRNVLERVPRDPLLRELVYFETVSYDDPDAHTPMAANESPQQSVNRYKPIPSECDLTVVLLWSRFGTKLSVDQPKPDGSRYGSGTEWEYEDAADGLGDRGPSRSRGIVRYRGSHSRNPRALGVTKSH